jgi:hypothetical protein
MDSTNDGNCGAFGSLLSAVRTILHHWPVTERVCLYLSFRNNTSAGLIIQNSLYNSSNLIDVFRYKLHSFFEFRICWILCQIAPSLQMVVQCGSQTVLPFRLYKESVLWLIAGHCNPVLGRGNVTSFLRLPHKNRDGWSYEKHNYVRHQKEIDDILKEGYMCM